jgi:hypothetical protein
MRKLYATVALVALAASSFAQWVTDPAINNLICSQPQDQQDARLVSDTKHGAIITWVDFRNDQNEMVADIYAQRITTSGVTIWGTNGMAVCTNAADQTAPVLIEDGAGGTIIAWQDWRSGNRDIYAQRIDSLGNVLWTANGLGVVVKNTNQGGLKIVSDGADGAVIVWEDSINGNLDIFAQHVAGNGTSTWTAGGVAVCTATDKQTNPRVVVDATGAAYFTWQDRRNGNDYDIYCQKLNAAGAPQWTANGVAINTATNSQINPKMELDASGAIIIAWQNFITGAGYDVYAQRVDAAGNAQWTAGGIPICALNGNQSAIDVTTENITDGAIIAWKDGRNTNVNIYCQKVDFNGNRLWTSSGVLISEASRNQINPNIVGDGIGGGIIAWQDSVADIWDVFAQRISSTGESLWTTGGTAIGIATDNQTSPKNISDGIGGSIFSFQDKRSGDFDIYAYKIAGDTTTGIALADASLSVTVFPNPFSSATTIRLPKGVKQVRVFDAVGRQVHQASNISGTSYTLNRANLASGTYVLSVQVSNAQYSTLLIIE